MLCKANTLKGYKLASLPGALETIASLTVSLIRRRALCEQVEWIAELARDSIESPHDRTLIATRVAGVLEALPGGS